MVFDKGARETDRPTHSSTTRGRAVEFRNPETTSGENRAHPFLPKQRNVEREGEKGEREEEVGLMAPPTTLPPRHITCTACTARGKKTKVQPSPDGVGSKQPRWKTGNVLMELFT